jgi:hypothetical protein
VTAVLDPAALAARFDEAHLLRNAGGIVDRLDTIGRASAARRAPAPRAAVAHG